MDIGQVMTIMFVVSIVLTLAHFLEEFAGRKWKYYARLTGSDWPHRTSVTGMILFILVPMMALTYIAYRAYSYQGSVFCIGLLLGIRIGDIVLDHLVPAVIGTPIPGHQTAIILCGEVFAIIYYFGPYLASCNGASVIFGPLMFGMIQPLVIVVDDWRRRR